MLKMIECSDERYADSRRIWNGLLEPHPAAIAECATSDDVIAAIGVARRRGLTISVRGGGHGVAGLACRDGSLMIDLRAMRDVTVDASRRVARAGGGATWADFDQATAAHKLATTGGLISSTGIGGLTLGGGIGWLVRRYGLACDNVVGAQIVTADASLRYVDAGNDPDLFWALRGGGMGLGVVTSLDYALHPVSVVVAGMVMLPTARALETLRFFRDFCAAAPDSLTSVLAFTYAPPAPFVPRELHGEPVVAIAVCWCGDPTEADRVLAPLRAFGPPAVDGIRPMPYADVQTMLDPTAPAHQFNYWKSAFVPELDEERIAHLVARGTALPSPLAQLHVHHLGGAISRVARGKTAFDHRDSPFLINMPTMWSDRAATDAMKRWTRATYAELVGKAPVATYVNFHDRDDEPASAWRGTTSERLKTVKDLYDPERLFGSMPG